MQIKHGRRLGGCRGHLAAIAFVGGVALSRDNIAAPHFRTIQACLKDLPQGLREIELAANPLIGPSSWRMDHADF